VNITNYMNINDANPREMERALAEVLRNLLKEASWLHGWTVESVKGPVRLWDLHAAGPVPTGGRAVLCVECKRHFQPSQFLGVSVRSCDVGRSKNVSRVLGMPRVSPRMAALCQANGWSWYDLAGNCRLEIPGVLLIERSGREPIKAHPRSGANLGTREAGRIVRALLAPENAGRRWTQRSLATHFQDLVPSIPDPSLALVNKVIQHLRDQAFLEPLTNRGFRVRDYEGLLRAWREAYQFGRHSRRPYFTLLQGRALQEKLRELDLESHGRLAYAVFSAADWQAPTVRQPRTWLYLDAGVEQEFQSAIEAKPVDSGENIVVLIPDDSSVFYGIATANNRLACTNAVQTYVDLAHAGGRGEEGADAILQQRLRPVWSGARQ
jgi:hypothetical protein